MCTSLCKCVPRDEGELETSLRVRESERDNLSKIFFMCDIFFTKRKFSFCEKNVYFIV